MPCAGVGSRATRHDAEGQPPPKQYRRLGHDTLVGHTLRALQQVSRIRATLLVVAPGDTQAASLLAGRPVQIVARGGETRAATVAQGLQCLAELGAREHDWVLVHDAARCLVTPAQIDRLLDACLDDAVGGLLALPLPDTLKEEGDGRVARTLPRSGKWLAQTPQMFRLGLLRDALSGAAAQGVEVTDESSAIEALGLAPRLIEGSAQNFKVTYASDFELAEAVLLARAAAPSPSVPPQPFTAP